MRAPVLVAAAFIGAVVATAYLVDRSPQNTQPPPPDTENQTPAKPRVGEIGHLILQIEGDANALKVTWITPKTSGYNPQRITSDHQAVLLDAKGDVLGSYPIDLTPFDLDPARVGRGLRVNGCEVRDTRVATIHSVPYLDGLDSIRIQHRGRLLGRVAGAVLLRMIEEGQR